MNLFKKTTATLALVALLSGIFSTGVSAASTAEIEAANFLAKAGIIVDHQDNPDAYSLDQNVLRQEIAAVARGIANLEKKTTCDGTFKDVSATKPNDWACYTIEQLSDNGLIALNENFRPEDNISKAEGIGMIVKAAFGDKYEYDATLETTWQEQVVAFAVSEGVTSNFTNYDTPATRGFVFAAGSNAMQSNPDNGEDIKKIMCELLGICDEEGEDKEGEDKDPTTPVVKGSFEITLNPKTPAAQTIPRSGLVPFGKFDISAGKEDVKIDSVKLTREGLSERTDIRRVYFEKNGIRVSNRSSVSIDEDAIVTFTPSLTVRAGTTETLDLIVEMKSTGDGAVVGAEHRFAIKSESDVDASTAVGGTYPLRTALMRVGSYKVEEVKVTPISSDTTHNVGAEKVLLTEFQLTTNGERDNLFKSITMRNAGTADAGASLSNIEIQRDGKKVSSEVVTSGRDITIYVNDTIKNGRSENYQVRADITGAEREKETYQFEIRNESDLTVVEEVTGFSAPVDLTTGFDGDKKWGIVTVEGGDFLVSRDTAYTLNQTVSSSTNDVVLYAAKINVKEEVTVEDVEVIMSIIDKAAEKLNLENFSSLRLLVGGATVATYTPNEENKTEEKVTFKFESNFNIRAGQSTLQITGNLKSNIEPNSKFTIDTVNLGGSKGEIRYVSNDEKVKVNGTAKGIATMVADGDLNLTRNDGIDNNNIVPGSTDKLVLGFSARANDVSDVKITGMNFEIVEVESSDTSSGSIDIKDISNVRLYKDGKLVQNGTRNNFDFNSLDITLAKNTSSNFELLVDFSNSIKKGKEFQVVLNGKGINARNVSSNKQIKFESTTSVVKSREFKFTDGGELRLTKNSSQVQTSILTPSSSEASVFKFDLRADDDDIMVTDIYVTNILPKTKDDDKDYLDLNDSVRSSSLYIDGKTYKGDIVSKNKIHFAIGSNGLVVKRDQIKTGDVRIALHDSSERSKAELQLAIKDKDINDKDEVTGTKKGIKAISDSTGAELEEIKGDSNVESNKHLVARSKPTIAMANFTAGSTDVYKFTVTADANRKITLEEINVELGGSAMSGDKAIKNGELNIFRDSISSSNKVFYKKLGNTTQNIESNLNHTSNEKVTDTASGAINFEGTAFVGDKVKVALAPVGSFGGASEEVTLAEGDNATAIVDALVTKLNAATNVTALNVGGKLNIGVTGLAATEESVITVVITKKSKTETITEAADQKWNKVDGVSREVGAGQTVTFFVTLEGSDGGEKDSRRESRITEVKYFDEVNLKEGEAIKVIETSKYNVGLPTTTSSYQY